ncbi:MAG TPA: pseudouridine synthase [Mariniphaga sp.]|nr:pseudouridine synthase [Mariniphaga sp.]
MNRNTNKSRGNVSPQGRKASTGKRIGKSRVPSPDSRGGARGRVAKGVTRGVNRKEATVPGTGSLAGKKKVIHLKKRTESAAISKAPVYRKQPEKTSGTGEMRLNRFIANAGVCSRRDADKYIAAGLVTVNGTTVTELGVKVKTSDDIRFDGRKLNAEKKVYLLLNKPKDFVTTTDDPYAERTVMDLVKNACEERIYPVGRLDKSTTGVLLFTNDGELSDKLTHPSHNIKKIYQVTLDKPLTKNDMLQLADGIELEDGPIAADVISFIDQTSKNEVGIEIHSGRNRIVRRMFEHLGYKVRKLDRVFFAGLTKKNLTRGKWRFLSYKEVQFLKMK